MQTIGEKPFIESESVLDLATLYIATIMSNKDLTFLDVDFTNYKMVITLVNTDI